MNNIIIFYNQSIFQRIKIAVIKSNKIIRVQRLNCSHFICRISGDVKVCFKVWQKKYLNATVNVAPALAGSVSLMNNLIYQGDYSFVIQKGTQPASVIDFYKSLSQPAATLPSDIAFNSSTVFIEIQGTGSYSIQNMDEFLTVLNVTKLIPLYHGICAEPQRHVDVRLLFKNKTQSGFLPIESKFFLQ